MVVISKRDLIVLTQKVIGVCVDIMFLRILGEMVKAFFKQTVSTKVRFIIDNYDLMK